MTDLGKLEPPEVVYQDFFVTCGGISNGRLRPRPSRPPRSLARRSRLRDLRVLCGEMFFAV